MFESFSGGQSPRNDDAGSVTTESVASTAQGHNSARATPVQPPRINRTVLLWYTVGLLMLPGIFMPLCKGCDRVTKYPVEMLVGPSANAGSNLMLLLVFGVPLMIALWLTIVALTKSRQLLLGQLWLQIASLVLGAVVLWFPNRDTGWKELVQGVLAILPMVIGLPLGIGAPIRRRQWSCAWGRLQQLTIGVSWIMLNLMCLLSSMLLLGYWYTSAMMIAVAIVAEISKGRLAHDLWDRNQPVQPLQFSLKRIFVWMTLLPLLAAYYRSIDPLVNWLFKS